MTAWRISWNANCGSHASVDKPERMIILTIYTVRRGDSLYAIANKYGVTVDALIYDNQIANPLRLVEGQAIYIPVTSVSYRVRPGDSVYSIARSYNTTVAAITAANPTLNPARLYPGQTITIPFPNAMLGNAQVNGFTVSGSETTLREWMPYLTYISFFSWQADAGGGITPINDDRVRTNAREANVAPLMSVTNIQPGGGFSSDIAHAILTNEEAQSTLLTNIMAAMRQRNYYGVIFDIEYVYPYDRESYNQFLRRAVSMLHAEGYIVMTAIAPKTSATQAGTLYEAHDYPVHGELVDYVIIMTYEWGYLYGPPMAVAPINEVRRVLDYAVSVIPSNKILMGMPNYAYDWTLPFVQGSAARPMSNTAAIAQASDVGAVIKYDEQAQAPFYNYYDSQGRQHEVWFDDARSIEARLRLIHDYNLAGLSYWTIDNLFRAQFLVLHTMYNIAKVI
ncbi:spore germination protein [Sporobacter termitidis DSM 10068]|uniref:Spore germination protein n=2 Tax=Sporobacter TaxID=44748 RepID=A0A1M5YTR8_9FIRM|nr:spore germination protein [Sporobacter termitidis DSM 10068]